MTPFPGSPRLLKVRGIQLAGGNDPVQMGRQVAQSVYGEIGK